jgi:hypothetical protein
MDAKYFQDYTQTAEHGKLFVTITIILVVCRVLTRKFKDKSPTNSSDGMDFEEKVHWDAWNPAGQRGAAL